MNYSRLPKSIYCFLFTVLGIALGSTQSFAMLLDSAGCSGPSGGIVNSDGFASTGAVALQGVPAYSWYKGCGPTSAASIIGYWDLKGFPNLFDAAGDDVFLTQNVRDQISSPGHNAKYDPFPDLPGPALASTSIADWFRTSVDPLRFGWSSLSFADDAFIGYAAYQGYDFDAFNKRLGDTSTERLFDWSEFTDAIDREEPVMFLIDTDGNGGTDHFVPVLGYDDRNDEGRYYGLYTSWSEQEDVVWKPFEPLGNPWGVGYATFVTPPAPPPPGPSPEPIPEPASIAVWLLLIGAGLVFGRRASAQRISEKSQQGRS